LEEAEALCGRVAIIDAGKIIAIGSPQELKAQVPGNDIITLVMDQESEALADRLRNLPFVHQVTAQDKNLTLYVDNGAQDLPLTLDEVRSAGVKILSVNLHEQSLEDVFIHYTGKSIREEESKKVSFLAGAGIPRRPGR
jgi:ABC-2 type transport system ATP-binding protein